MRRLLFRPRLRRFCLGLFALGLVLGLWLGQPRGPVQAADARQLVQLGVDRYQAGRYLAALEPWQQAYTAYKTVQDLPALAIVSENLARAYQQMGQTSQEVHYWEQAIQTVRSLGERDRLGRLYTEQAQAYSRLGQHRRAIAILCGAAPDSACRSDSALALAAGDPLGQVAALGSLGEAYRASGNLVAARLYLERGDRLTGELQNPTLEGALANSLGNVLASQAISTYRRADQAAVRSVRPEEAQQLRAEADSYNRQAIDRFQTAAGLDQAPAAQIQTQLSLVAAHQRAEDAAAAAAARRQAQALLDQMPDSQAKAFAAIRLADLAIEQPGLAPGGEAVALLTQALAIGEAIQNPRVISFAQGKLGHLDELAGRYEAALDKTQQARLAADQDLAARDSLYRWEWQAGRIYQAQGNRAGATQAYAQAVALLEQIRSDILSANRDLQFDFRDTVEPIYREYAALNLKAVPQQQLLKQEAAAFEELEKALTTLDSLKVAELQSYFANDCVIVPAQARADEVGQSTDTAVFSTAISADRLTVIASLPDGSKKIAQTSQSADQIADVINRYRISLERGIREYRFDQRAAQELYELLVAPFAPNLTDVKTLVFVNDGLLRSVPMAALYDGGQYLVEKFAIATTPSLTLTAPDKVERDTLSALLLGVSEASQVPPDRPFSPLPAVETELEVVSQRLPNSKVLLNEEFSIGSLKQSLADQDYRILHMATHGTFGFSPDENFVVVGAKQTSGEYNQTLTISELDQLIRDVSDPSREPIELLTLTACETAIGDNRSTLGLAGVAVRAGVRSAIATLWSVSDESTAELIAGFYDRLQDPSLTKAEALQQAQLAMLDSDSAVRRHPYRWAPFILIGNWL